MVNVNLVWSIVSPIPLWGSVNEIVLNVLLGLAPFVFRLAAVLVNTIEYGWLSVIVRVWSLNCFVV